MADFQIWLVHTFARATPIARLMHTKWAWPASESIHFISLSLLVGTIFLFDLRLLWLGKKIPIGALPKLVPWGLGAYAASMGSGILFARGPISVYNPPSSGRCRSWRPPGSRVAVLFHLSPDNAAGRRRTLRASPK
jgi:hypothetical protein